MHVLYEKLPRWEKTATPPILYKKHQFAHDGSLDSASQNSCLMSPVALEDSEKLLSCVMGNVGLSFIVVGPRD